MFDPSAIVPFVIGFIVLAAVVSTVAVAMVARLVVEGRRPARPAVALPTARAAAASRTAA